MSLLNSKKGQGNAVLGILLILLIYGVVFITCYLVLNSFLTSFATTSAASDQTALAGQKFLATLGFLDYVMVIMTIVLIIGIGITTYRLATPPIFFIINLFAAFFYGFFGYILSYIFQSYTDSTLIQATLIYFPKTLMICTNLHWVALICIAVGSITLFGKKPVGQYIQQ
jgi:hypothetical protein